MSFELATFSYKLVDSRSISSKGMSYCNYVPITESILDPGRPLSLREVLQVSLGGPAEGVRCIWEVIDEKIGKIAAVV